MLIKDKFLHSNPPFTHFLKLWSSLPTFDFEKRPLTMALMWGMSRLYESEVNSKNLGEQFFCGLNMMKATDEVHGEIW